MRLIADYVPIIFVAPEGEPPEAQADYRVSLERAPAGLLDVLEKCARE
jgi:hypothetical protein